MRPYSSPARQRPARGFTLIEVMIVVAIVAILSSVAVPAYSDYVRRGQLTDAFGQLASYRSKMEQYYQDNRNYGSGDDCASDASANSWNSFRPQGDDSHFDFACVPDDDLQGYTLTATGKSGSNVAGYAYTINHAGQRRTTTFKSSTVTATCWLTKSATC